MKWVEEKILQLYFVENFHKYRLWIGMVPRRISACRFNYDFDGFPDLICTIEGKEYPAEVEWRSSYYDHFDNPLHEMFVRQGGFVIVLEKDIPLENVRQLLIDREDFRLWFVENSPRLFDESVDNL